MNTKGHLLIVDDNFMNRDLLSRRLKHEGYTIEIAEDGIEALQIMKTKMFDLVLLDIMMPRMNGFEVLENLKRNPRLADIPVIIISAMDDIDSTVRCIELGAEDYLTKPFNKMILKARIGATLEKKRLRDKERAYIGELAVMQQIDRDLNANLNLDRVMQITLDWSLQQVQAEAGMAGIVEDNKAHIIATHGYQGASMPELLPDTVRMVIENGEPLRTDLRRAKMGTSRLSLAQSQVVVPIQREQRVAGVMLLESMAPDHFTDERLAFLARLSDHAAIAIVNAQLYAAVQAANKAKSDFMSLAAHELKVPMTSIKGYASMLLSGSMGQVNAQQANSLKIISSNVDRMTTLVGDLADVSRIEAQRLRLDIGEVSLRDVVREVVRSANSQTEAKQQVLMMNIPASLPPVWGDYIRLIQILTNLVSNASKYTPEGGLITVGAEVVENEMVQMNVRDTGIGISAEDQTRVFQKFFRADDIKAGNIPGTGLGLNITKNLVEMQGGKIWFESELHQGTTFYFTVPISANTDHNDGEA